MRRRYQRYLNRFKPAFRLRHIPMVVGMKLKSRLTAVKVPYSDHLGYIVDKDFTVADFACLGGTRQGLHYFFAPAGGDHHFHVHFWLPGGLIFPITGHLLVVLHASPA